MRILPLFLVLVVIILSSWLWIYNAYDVARTNAYSKYRSGDLVGAREELRKYMASPNSFLLRKVKYFGYFAENLAYMDGVLSAAIGDTKNSEEKFQLAARSKESNIAASALYNGAEYLVERAELDAAREKYSEALKRNPYDVQAKINLELLLQKIRKRDKEAALLKSLLGRELTDFWLRKIPEENDSSGGSPSKRIWR